MKYICLWILILNYFDLELMYWYIEDFSFVVLNIVINYINCVID